MKVLIVDDHSLIRKALGDLLRDLNGAPQVTEARSAAEAYAALEADASIDLILLDLGLPDQPGLTVLEEVRARYPQTPVVVVSGSEQSDLVVRALDAGAMGFVPKSSSNEVLMSALGLVLSGGVYLPPSVLAHGAGAPVGNRVPGKSVARPENGARMLPADIGLTERQSQVLRLIVQGKPNKLICRALNMAEGTVKVHITSILRALNVSNRTQAVIEVSRLGLKLD